MMNTNKISEVIIKDFGFLRDKKIAVALSGGADSVCLLHLLCSLKVELNISLSAIHINHNLRGEESDRDENFVRDFCKRLDIPLLVKSIEVLKEAKAGESTELAARRLRYAAFYECESDFIATAHTAEDSLETFFINFVRGTGLKGLSGIPKTRDKLVRPISSLSRAEVEEYCRLNSLSFVTDSSNLTDDYTRNKIRHNIIPELKKINPSIISVAGRNMDIIKKDSDFLEELALEAFNDIYKEGKGLDIFKLSSLNFSLSSRVVLIYTDLLFKKSLEYNRLLELLELAKNGEGKIQLYKNIYGEVKGNYLRLFENMEIEFSLKTEIVSIENFKKRIKINNLLLYNAIDYDKIVGKLVIRNRQSGDKISPVGRGITKAIRRIQNEKAIDIAYRDKLPLAADDLGVIWCYKTATDNRVKIDVNTKNVLLFLVNDN